MRFIAAVGVLSISMWLFRSDPPNGLGGLILVSMAFGIYLDIRESLKK